MREKREEKSLGEKVGREGLREKRRRERLIRLSPLSDSERGEKVRD